MNETVEKLKEYLEKYTNNRDNLKKHMVLSINEDYDKYQALIDMMSKEHLLNVLNIPSFAWQKNSFLYTDFNELIHILKEAKFKVKEILEVIIYFIERNLSTGILTITDEEESQKHFSLLDYTKTVKASLYPTLQRIPLELDKRRKKFTNTCMQNASSIDNLEDIVKYHQILDEHLIKKMPHLEAEDSVLIIQSLKYFGVSREILDEITGYLMTLVNKNKKPEPILKVIKRTEMPPKVSDRNRKILFKELTNYYDIINNRAIRVLSLEEELYVIYLMQKLELNTDVINKSLDDIHKLSNNNPFSLYARFYPKYVSYQDILEVKESMQALDAYFEQIFICDNEEYEIIKMCFSEEFNKLLNILPNDYSYEYHHAKSLKK